ncbi:MAG: MmgE/PrpD family protein [Chloroflexi bacterium]|nr:MmgE/PrpD family protein [Chloroflexota bacterium]MBV9597919.1 MmgE/PrpD family protein [Chloroflexota bacterium]
MDRSSQKIVEYADALRVQDLTGGCVLEAKRHVLDSFGCVLGGFDSPPSRIARAYSTSVSAEPGARVFGEGNLTAPDVAAFANTVMLRYLDFNDTFVAGSQHPSDMIPAILAAAEAVHASGEEVLLAIVLAYEVAGALAAGVSLRPRGWDQGTFLGLASAVAAGKVMRLSREQLGNALSLALVPHIPLRQTRAGELSMWKGCATAAAIRDGVFAAQLSQLGMTGPPEPFEGKDGLWERVTDPFEFSLPCRTDAYVLEQTSLKLHPSEYHSQAFLDLAPAIVERAPVQEIASIDIETYWLCYSEIGSEPAKWEPDSRETADHSLPFILATALRDGALTLGSFGDANLHDPQLRELMRRIRIEHNARFTDRFPEELVSRLEVTTRSGDRFVLDGAYPKGHVRNPATPVEVDAKFDALAAGVVGPERREAIRAAVDRLDQCEDVVALVDTLVWTVR